MSDNGFTGELTDADAQRLLGRPVRGRVDASVRAALRGQRILVTGAAGSIGSALVQELAACEPDVLGLFDHSELGLFAIERDLLERAPGLTVDAILADVTRQAAVRRACRRIQPDVVYHVAAYKHVTMAERAPSVAAHVNVVGTANVAAGAAAAGARFVLISSDKASDPTSVMGATKRLAERVTLGMASPVFRPIVVRFGNVLGSSGSVTQIMRECIRAGRPVPVTDPAATRYFMTAREAVALVLRADLLGRAPETFWLDMGDPVRLGDLVNRLMRLEAAAGHRRVAMDIIGLRPGEKLTESLVDPQLIFERTLDERIRVARDVAGDHTAVREALRRLRLAGSRADDRLALETLAASIASFVPSAQAQDAARNAAPGLARAVRRASKRCAA